MTCDDCRDCEPLRIVTGDSNAKGYEVVTNGRLVIKLCPKHALVDRLAEALRVYAEKTTLHSIRGDNYAAYAVFNSPGPELAKQLLVEYDGLEKR